VERGHGRQTQVSTFINYSQGCHACGNFRGYGDCDESQWVCSNFHSSQCDSNVLDLLDAQTIQADTAHRKNMNLTKGRRALGIYIYIYIRKISELCA